MIVWLRPMKIPLHAAYTSFFLVLSVFPALLLLLGLVQPVMAWTKLPMIISCTSTMSGVMQQLTEKFEGKKPVVAIYPMGAIQIGHLD